MLYHIIINTVKSVTELKNSWSNYDFVELLDRFGFENGKDTEPEELEELLFMAISDFEPEEAAEIILDYKFSNRLNKNQIIQISNEMLESKISEEYADISLHYQLFNINQLLHKAYNGTFPNAKATIIEFEITPNKEITKEHVLKVLNHCLANGNVMKRLYASQLAGKEKFNEAESIVWSLNANGENVYTLVTSDYWISKDEFNEIEFDATVDNYEEDD